MVVLDFAKVKEADSSALAMISAIKRDFSSRDVEVSIKDFPQSVKVVADIYDAAGLLG
jgi:ABC-type transporter Mla MlaB component